MSSAHSDDPKKGATSGAGDKPSTLPTPSPKPTLSIPAGRGSKINTATSPLPGFPGANTVRPVVSVAPGRGSKVNVPAGFLPSPFGPRATPGMGSATPGRRSMINRPGGRPASTSRQSPIGLPSANIPRKAAWTSGTSVAPAKPSAGVPAHGEKGTVADVKGSGVNNPSLEKASGSKS